MNPENGVYRGICLLFGEFVVMFVGNDGCSESQKDNAWKRKHREAHHR